MLITANTRLARVRRLAHDKAQIESGLAAWPAPDILPLGAWMASCWRTWLLGSYGTTAANPVQLLSSSQERAIWEGIIARSDAASELIQVAPTADAARDAWNLMHAWRVPIDGRDWEDSRDTEAFRGWANEFRRICEKRNVMSAAALPEFIAARMTSGEIPVPPYVQLAGFAEFTPAQDRLIEAMRRKEANVEVCQAPASVGPSSTVRVAFPDTHQEIRAAARWARKLLEMAAHSGCRELSIGIVVPELSKLRSPIERLFAEELHAGGRLSPDQDSRRAFNISLGPAFSDYPLIQSALRILRLNPAAAIPLDDITSLLRSPFLAAAQTEATACAALDAQLRRLREPELTLSEIVADAPPGIGSSLDHWQRECSKTASRQMPSEWSASFSSALKSIGWPGERPLNSEEYQITAEWNEMLSEFASLDSATGAVNRNAAVSMLQRMAADRQFQPQSESAPIQILGVFEASGITFDHLWIIGMHDTVWPGAAVPNPFLPLVLQRRLNLPKSTPQRELDFAARISNQLITSAANIVVSYPSVENDSELRPSPLFWGLPEVSIAHLELQESPGHAQMLYRSASIEQIEDSVAPRWNGAKARGGTSIFKQQAACPFQAFAKLRLGAEVLESAEPGLNAIERGELIHDLFHRLWREFGSHETLSDTPRDTLTAVIREEVHNSIAKMALKKRALQQVRFADIERHRLERLATDWLDLEMQRQPFIVLPLEENRRVNVGGIDLTIRADRMDRLGDGTHVILDYKTRKHGPAEWEGDHPDEPQLPLYAITAGVPLSGVVFGVVKTGEIKFTGRAASDGIVPGVKAGSGDDALANKIPKWREVLESLAADFRAGKAMVHPKDPRQTCRICRLQILCRISESNRLDEVVEETDAEVRND
jgi:ATP-dependent helicase/nuclease subunit B